MHRNSWESFTNQPKSEKNSNRMQNKTAEMESNVIAELFSLNAEKKMSLEEIMNHSITDECLFISNTNTVMVKVEISKLVQKLN